MVTKRLSGIDLHVSCLCHLDQTNDVLHQPHDHEGGEHWDEEHEGGRQDEKEYLEDKIIQDGRNFNFKEPPLFPSHLEQGEGGGWCLFLCQGSFNCVDVITVTNSLR